MAKEIRFYTDEHVAKAVVRGLRERGADVLTVQEAGMLGASDREHLERARQEGRKECALGRSSWPAAQPE